MSAGVSNTETSATGVCYVSINSCTSSSDALVAITDEPNGAGVAAYGYGNGWYGIYAAATGSNSVGVSRSGAGWGAYLVGSGPGGTGVYGQSQTYGIHGKAMSGWGVWGEGADRGVYGVSDNEGVVGFGNSVGVRADSPGIALRVTGKVELRRSGSATIAGTSTTPLSSVVVSSVALSAKSMVLVTVQKNVAGVWVRAAVPDVAGSSVTIYLNKAVTKSVPVAWMVSSGPRRE